MILKFLGGGGLSHITDRLADAYEARQRAETSQEKIQADIAIARLEGQRDAQTRGSGTWIPKVVRAAWAGLFLAYFGKVVLWDKMLGWGATPDLSPNQWWLVYTVMGFYFLRDVTGR